MEELIIRENDIALLNENVAKEIVEFEKGIKALKEKEDLLKQEILKEMESKGIVKIDMPTLTITYIAPTKRETLDSKTLKLELPDIYDTYIKISDVKSSIRMKVN